MDKDKACIINQSLINQEINEKNILETYNTLKSYITKTPSVLLNLDGDSKDRPLLKLETFHPINSYKIRSALNVCLNILKNEKVLNHIKSNGIVTASAGNFSQGIAFALNLLNFTCELILAVPYTIPESKINKTKSLYKNIKIIKIINKQNWFDIVKNQSFDYNLLGDIEIEGEINKSNNPFYICPTSHSLEILGTSTIALELYDEYSDIDCFIVPWGGGGLSCGIALGSKIKNPNVKIYACEVDVASPLKESLKNNVPTTINATPSFVDGIGAPWVLENNFELAKIYIEDSLLCSVEEVAKAVKLLIEKNKVIAEGAGACSVAAYLKYKNTVLKDFKRIVCVISGGNIDNSKIIKILNEDYKDI